MRKEKEVEEPEERVRVEKHISIAAPFFKNVFLLSNYTALNRNAASVLFNLHMQSKYILYMDPRGCFSPLVAW